jgi:hypothetical protein
MQKPISFYSLPINTFSFIFIAILGISCAREIPEGKTLQPVPISDSSHKNASETSASLFQFEGRYKVGDTSCTVAPVKMAFEVKWAKGHGIMHFFFDKTTSVGKSVFVSRDLGKGRDQFIFDDNLYNTGVFIRADGKEFPVERLKDSAKD